MGKIHALNSTTRVYLVGGAVRDKLLGLPVHDKDFVVVGADFEEMKSLGFVQVGADFPVFLHPKTHFEYALARIERKNGTGYQGFATETKGVTLADDLLRRDLTINALAIEVNGLFDDTPKTGEVIDFYGGLDDLNHKILRHISPAFCEDPLRILRTVRFLARYFERGFKIADETMALMQAMAQNGELTHLSRERLWTESVKAMESGTGHFYWQALKNLNILPYFLKELNECWQDEPTFKSVINHLTLAKKYHMAVQFAILCSGYLNNDKMGNEKLNKDLIAKIAQKLNAPKYPVQIANLLSEFYCIFNQKPTANDILNFIEKTKAHQGNLTILTDLLTSIYIVNNDKNLNQAVIIKFINNAIETYKAIGMDDIGNDLTGKEIGLALRQLRITKIQDCLNLYF